MTFNHSLWPLVWWLRNSWRGVLLAVLVITTGACIMNKFLLIETTSTPSYRHVDGGLEVVADVATPPDLLLEDPRGANAAVAAFEGPVPPAIFVDQNLAGVGTAAGLLTVNTGALQAAPGWGGTVVDLGGPQLTADGLGLTGGLIAIAARGELLEAATPDGQNSVVLGVRHIDGIHKGFYGVGVLGSQITGSTLAYGSLWRRPSEIEPGPTLYQHARRASYVQGEVIDGIAMLTLSNPSAGISGYTVTGPDQSEEVRPHNELDGVVDLVWGGGSLIRSEVVTFLTGPLVPCLLLIGDGGGTDYSVVFDSFMVR